MFTSSESIVLHTGALLGSNLDLYSLLTLHRLGLLHQTTFGQGDVGSDVKHNKLCKYFSCKSGLLQITCTFKIPLACSS